MCRDEKFINLAIQVAKLSECKKRVGAIVVKGNRILGVGHNKKRTHPKQNNIHIGKKSQTIHAELSAIINSSSSENCTMYIARVIKNGKVAMAKSCISCVGIMKEAGIKKIIYTDKNGNISKENI